MSEAFICDYIRTPIGRFGGALATVRADDLGAVPLKALIARNPQVDWEAVDDVIFGCANQAGEDNRNVARMSLLLAGLPASMSGTTINRLCGSGMDAVISAARAIRSAKLNSWLPVVSRACRVRRSSYRRRKQPILEAPRSTIPRSAGGSSIR
jgi:acetyl-CoA acyltransferase